MMDSLSEDVSPPQEELAEIRTWFRHLKDLKKQGYQLPLSRHRFIIAPPMTEHVPSKSTVTVEARPSHKVDTSTKPLPWQKEKELEDEGQVHLWLMQRKKAQTELNNFVNLEQWLEHKSSSTKLETKVLKKIYSDKKNELDAQKAAEIAAAQAMKPIPRLRKYIPMIRLPEPPCLSVLYNHLLKRKVKVLDLFTKGEWEHQKISREDFIEGMKAFDVPLTHREMEDVVVYLSSKNRHNIIYREDLANSYKCYSADKKNGSQKINKYDLPRTKTKKKVRIKTKKTKYSPSTIVSPQPSLLEVPSIDIEPDRMPLTYEDMEEVGKRYKEQRRQSKKKINPLVYVDRCRLVRSGKKAYDDHCLPSTLPDEFGEMTNAFRQATFLVYLQTVKACEAYQVPLTEKTLMKALLYPGDKLIMEKDNALKLRQPGGYYDEKKEFIPTVARFQMIDESVTVKKPQKQKKKMTFKEFETLTRKLKHKCHSKSYREVQGTHPNFFWPGHLLDKLLLYLPKKYDKQLAIFSRIEELPHIYPAKYHSDSMWPISSVGYRTYGLKDKNKPYC